MQGRLTRWFFKAFSRGINAQVEFLGAPLPAKMLQGAFDSANAFESESILLRSG